MPILKHRLELQGISHVVSHVSVAFMEGGGGGGGGGGWVDLKAIFFYIPHER